jgi:hypothetical protein
MDAQLNVYNFRYHNFLSNRNESKVVAAKVRMVNSKVFITTQEKYIL